MNANKQTMGSNIMFYMERDGIDRKRLAEAIQEPYSSVVGWINGSTYPRIDKIEKMARYFNISKADLVEPRSTSKDVRSIRIPVFGMVAAGNPIEAIENIRDHIDIPSDWNGDYRGFIVHGDSMSPRILDGDILVVRRQDDAESGDIVVAMTDDGATVKKLIKHSDHITLQPFNPSYEPMYFSNGIKLWGKVVEMRARF